jgi:RHS repeat-associated protein
MSSGTTAHRYYVHSPERVVAIVTRGGTNPGTRFLHTDHLGSVDALTLADGTIEERRSYDAFGQRRSPVWGQPPPMSFSSKTTLGFTGHESDDELGLVNMKGRIYDPKVGRFLTTDPIVSAPLSGQSWNPYSYVGNSPLNFVDPSGFEPDTVPFAYTYIKQFPDGELGLVGILPPPDPPEKEDEGEKVGAYVPPVDVSPTGNTATYDPQPATSADEDWRQEPASQFRAGMLAGLALGFVPFAGVGEQLLDAADVLPQTQSFRQGAAIGQIFGGLGQLLLGATGVTLGGGASATGIGALIGVPAIAVSKAFVVGGLANIGAGAWGLMTTGSGSGGPQATTPAAAKGGSVGGPSRSAVMDRAQLPHRGGLARYVPPKSWNATEPLPRGPQNGYRDVHGNEWVRGPSRTAGQPFEWDVQLHDGTHLNVSLDGEITHGLNLNGKPTWP